MAQSLSPRQLYKRCREGQLFVLIDGRNKTYSKELSFPVEMLRIEEDFNDKRIMNEELEAILLGEDEESSLDQVTTLEQQLGIEMYYVKGGMKEWAMYIESVQVGELTDGGEVYQFIRPSTGHLSYMIISEAEILLLNPDVWIQPYLDFVEDKAFTFRHIVDTCLHDTHISGGPTLAEEVEETYWLPHTKENISFSYEPISNSHVPEVGNTNIPIKISQSDRFVTFIVDQHYIFTSNEEATSYDGKGTILSDRMLSYKQLNKKGWVSAPWQQTMVNHVVHSEKIQTVNKGQIKVTNEEIFMLEYGC
ncbi:hypothetical protein [Pontibacillus salipaludis]|uniref:Uncharacterized protein n=1 Tax=Pontibacillus salipaludis TaxID=1697394 RepID=A0ABQ1QEX7_9BACI|nr:hypothetical protein [Pontibacillus salipaludis]GGD24720.1 hypothetical protein GCM10011389_35610 [Pontibacillus salipaludis]